MATTPIEITAPTGLGSLTVDLYPPDSTTADVSGLATAEQTNALGFYRADVTGAISGTKRVVVKDGGTWIATTYLYLEDDTSVWREIGLSQLEATQPMYAPAKAGDAMTLDSAEDIYQAQIRLNVDDANSQDEWACYFLKNGEPVASADVSSVTLQVVKRADGTDLISSGTSMTEIGSTGVFKYDEGTNRTTAGEDVVAIVSATIDSGTRTFRWIIGRDSTS